MKQAKPLQIMESLVNQAKGSSFSRGPTTYSIKASIDKYGGWVVY